MVGRDGIEQIVVLSCCSCLLPRCLIDSNPWNPLSQPQSLAVEYAEAWAIDVQLLEYEAANRIYCLWVDNESKGQI